VIRAANIGDIPALEELIRLSARQLAREDYSEKQIEAAMEGAWGVDTQLIRDGTFFVVEMEGQLAACGGWSRRKTLFGGDAMVGREAELLIPGRDAARIRAFFVHPDFARRGLGTMLLEHCEAEARHEGFTAAELVATLPGFNLYAACGYRELERKNYLLREQITIEFVTMKRSLV
jgi:N-acetylglutamate synthase-like GNAT family acetyltransferase